MLTFDQMKGGRVRFEVVQNRFVGRSEWLERGYQYRLSHMHAWLADMVHLVRLTLVWTELRVRTTNAVPSCCTESPI